jgi:hypothetical protein
MSSDEDGFDGRRRVYVRWKLTTPDGRYWQVWRHQGDRVELVGASPNQREAHTIMDGNRLYFLHNHPNAVETHSPMYAPPGEWPGFEAPRPNIWERVRQLLRFT